MLSTFITILLLAACFATVSASVAIYGILYLIVAFVTGGILLNLLGNLDLLTCIYIIVCASGMGVLLLWVVMTLTLKNTKRDDIRKTKMHLITRLLYFVLISFFPLLFLSVQLNIGQTFDLLYLFDSRDLQNYTYREMYGTNILELGYFLYLEDPTIIIFGGLILFFALIAAVFLTIEQPRESIFYKILVPKVYLSSPLLVLGGGMVDTLDLGSSAIAWGFKSLPSNLYIDWVSFKSMFFYFLFYIILSLLILVGVLITVAFYTLGERKVMAGIQRRKGPNVVGFHGVLQPIVDGLKLVLKENIIPVKADKYLFILAPLISFITAFSLWAFIPFSKISMVSDVSISILCLFALSSLGIYGVILGGWASNSKYAFLGALRTTAQMISYEIVLGTIYLTVSLLTGSLNLFDILQAQTKVWFIVPLWPFVIVFIIAMLAETNRAPFDLPEAEAEIVAGYNVEYSGIAFAFFFLAEYSNMLVFSALFSILFLGGGAPFTNSLFEVVFFIFKILLVAIAFIVIRAGLPRLRYDQLMTKSWNILLPIIFALFVIVLVIVLLAVGNVRFLVEFSVIGSICFLIFVVSLYFFKNLNIANVMQKMPIKNNISEFLAKIYNWNGTDYEYAFWEDQLVKIKRHVFFYPTLTPLHWWSFIILSGKKEKNIPVTTGGTASVNINQGPEAASAAGASTSQTSTRRSITSFTVEDLHKLSREIGVTEQTLLFVEKDVKGEELLGFFMHFPQNPTNFDAFRHARKWLQFTCDRFYNFKSPARIATPEQRALQNSEDYINIWKLCYTDYFRSQKNVVEVMKDINSLCNYVQARQELKCLELLNERFSLVLTFINEHGGNPLGCYDDPKIKANWKEYESLVWKMRLLVKWWNGVMSAKDFSKTAGFRDITTTAHPAEFFAFWLSVDATREQINADPTMLAYREHGIRVLELLRIMTVENVTQFKELFPLLEPGMSDKSTYFVETYKAIEQATKHQMEVMRLAMEEHDRLEDMRINKDLFKHVFFSDPLMAGHSHYFENFINAFGEPLMPQRLAWIGKLKLEVQFNQFWDMLMAFPYYYHKEVYPRIETIPYFQEIQVPAHSLCIPQDSNELAEAITTGATGVGLPLVVETFLRSNSAAQTIPVQEVITIGQTNTLQELSGALLRSNADPIIYGGGQAHVVREINNVSIAELKAEAILEHDQALGENSAMAPFYLLGILALGLLAYKLYQSYYPEPTIVVPQPPTVLPKNPALIDLLDRLKIPRGTLEKYFLEWRLDNLPDLKTKQDLHTYMNVSQYIYDPIQNLARFLDNISFWIQSTQFLQFFIFLIFCVFVYYSTPLHKHVRRFFFMRSFWHVRIQEKTEKPQKIDIRKTWGQPRYNFLKEGFFINKIDQYGVYLFTHFYRFLKALRTVKYHYLFMGRIDLAGMILVLICLNWFLLTKIGEDSVFSMDYMKFPYDITLDNHWSTTLQIDSKIRSADLENYYWHQWFFERFDPTYMHLPDSSLAYQSFATERIPTFITRKHHYWTSKDWSVYKQAYDGFYYRQRPNHLNKYAISGGWMDFPKKIWPEWLRAKHFDSIRNVDLWERCWRLRPGTFATIPDKKDIATAYFTQQFKNGSWQYYVIIPLFCINFGLFWWHFWHPRLGFWENMDNPRNLISGPDRVFLNDAQKELIEREENNLYVKYMDESIAVWRLKKMSESSEETFREILAASALNWDKARKEASEKHWLPYTLNRDRHGLPRRFNESDRGVDRKLVWIQINNKRREEVEIEKQAHIDQWVPYQEKLNIAWEKQNILFYMFTKMTLIYLFNKNYKAPKFKLSKWEEMVEDDPLPEDEDYDEGHK